MPDTPLGLTYPDAAGHTRLWEHFQHLAEDVEALIRRPFGQLHLGSNLTSTTSEQKCSMQTTMLANGMTAASSALVVPVDGHYRISVAQRVLLTTTATLLVKQNESVNQMIIRAAADGTSQNVTLAGSAIRTLSAGDTLSLYAGSFTGTVYSGASESVFTAELVDRIV